jgi:nucleoside-diphosphate-sugar epimerase
MNMTAYNPMGANGQSPSVPKSVFITGANGFIGRALGDRYRALGADVRGMDIKADLASKVIAGNLTDPAGWAAHAVGCELFINTAAVVSMNAPWDLYRKVSVQGVRNCLNVAIAGGAKRFVQYSSVCAMGWDFSEERDERFPTVIGEEFRYGVAKAASEHLVLAAHAAGEIECTIIRPSDVYGPGSRAWITEPLKAVRSKTLMLPDHGKGRFSPVYIDDLLDGTLLAAGLPQGAGNIFIIGGGYTVSCEEFFGYHWSWAKRGGKPTGISFNTGVFLARIGRWINQRLGKVDEVCPDTIYILARRGGYSIAKAREVLGYSPKMTLAEGMRRSEEWLRQTGELSA